MLRRVVSVLGSFLMVGGVGLLVYVGIIYQRGQTQVQSTSPGWTAAQQIRGKELAQALARHQALIMPRQLATGARAVNGEPAVRLVIPRMNLDAPVVETPPRNGVWQVADWAVGHLTTTPNPGVPGNLALSAHDDIKGELFKRLGELRVGNEIRMYTRHAVYTYVVTSATTVDPSNISVLNSTTAATVTLISCTPYWVDTQRLIVQGVLKARAAA